MKPTGLPYWASQGATNVVEPTTQKNVGWAPSEIPPSSYENHWKQNVYRWLDYLSYDNVIVDDFICPPENFGSPVSSGGLQPFWTASGSGTNIEFDTNVSTGISGVYGAITVGRTSQGVSTLLTQGGGSLRDFLFEARCAHVFGSSGPTGVGGSELGLIGQVWFGATGPLSTWQLYAVASGTSSPTGISLGGLLAYAPTGPLANLEMERRGATLVARVNGIDRAAVGFPIYTEAPTIGIRVLKTFTGGTFILCVIDRIRFAVKR